MNAFEPHPVLYVDDEEANRLLFEITMGERFPVMVVDSAQAALDVMAAQPIDVLLTDYRMPRMNGVELCQRVAEQYPHVQRLLVTAYVDTQSAVDAINHGGVSRYLGKPWDADELAQIIRDATSSAVRARLTAQLQEEIWRRERVSALAALQGQVLHDLGNAASQLRMGCSALQEIVDEEPWSAGVREELRQELSDMTVAVGFVADLHSRVRGLHRSSVPAPERLGVADMLHSASVLGRASLPPRARIVIECAADLRLVADRTDVGRILVNLVTNAAQAMADAQVSSGRIWLRAAEDGDQVRIIVEDNGPGIAPSVRERIFEESFTTKGQQGSGIGLSTSRRLAIENGGSLALAPTPQGARFELALPRAVLVEAG